MYISDWTGYSAKAMADSRGRLESEERKASAANGANGANGAKGKKQKATGLPVAFDLNRRCRRSAARHPHAWHAGQCAKAASDQGGVHGGQYKGNGPRCQNESRRGRASLCGRNGGC